MAGARSFPSRVNHIQPQEPVSAGVASRPDRTMEGRTNYLKEVIDTIEAGRALMLLDQKVKSDVLEGQPVFWNDVTQQYEQALARVENDPDSGVFTAAPSADCIGMVFVKKVGNIADIVIWGVVAFKDLSNAIDQETVTPGRWYVSPVAAGKLVYQRPPVTVPACLIFGPLDACDENTWVFVQPSPKDFLEDHIHLQYDLVPLPAGEHTPPATGMPHVIDNPDVTKPGWLPADHSSFNGNAPEGAQFGYNLAAHSAVDRTWPPIPLASVVLEMYKEGFSHQQQSIHHDFTHDFDTIPSNDFLETIVNVPGACPHDSIVVNGDGTLPDDLILQAYSAIPGQVTVRAFNPTPVSINPGNSQYHINVLIDPFHEHVNGGDALEYASKHVSLLERVNSNVITFTNEGIWWMTNCFDQVPWPSELDTSGSSSSLSSESLSSLSSEAPHCTHYLEQMWLILSYVKMTFLTDKTVVTSLQPDTGQPLKYVNCDGEVAKTGDLFSQLVLSLLLEDEYEGGQMIKGVTDDNKFKRGWATEGLLVGSDKVILTGTHTRALNSALPVSVSNPRVYQGLITVDIQVDPTERELLPQIIALGDALERTYKGITYLGFPDGRDSGIRAKFVVPPEGLPLVPKLKIRVQIFGRANGTLTDMDTSYYISLRPVAGTPTPIVEGDTTLELDTDIEVVADEIHEVESEEINVTAGDTLWVTLERTQAGSPSYTSEIGLIRIGAVIVPGS